MEKVSPLGIDEVAVGGTELSVSSGVVTDNVILTAAKACTVSIYSVQGKLIGKYNVKSGDNVISVANLPAGVYLIGTGTTTCKIVKR